MQDDELFNLCKAIYRKHGEAIDLIVQYGATSKVLDASQSAVDKIVSPSFSMMSRNRIWFMTKEMAQYQDKILAGWPFLPQRYPIVWWFHYQKKKGKMQLTMEVGQVADSKLRIRLLKHIQKAGFKIGDKAFREESKFTRIYTYTKKMTVNEDGEVDDSDEYVSGLIEAMWKKSWGDTSNIVNALKSFKW